MRHPAACAGGVGLHQGHDYEPAAEREAANLERGPHELARVRVNRGDEHRPRIHACEALARELDCAAREQDEHEPGSCGGGAGGADERVCEHAGAVALRGTAQHRQSQPCAGADGDRRDRRARAHRSAAHGRERGREEERGEAEHQQQARQDEAEAAAQRAARAAQTPRAIDRKLCRRGSREHVRRCDGPLELLFREPLPPRHAQIAQECDVRGRSAEADEPDARPRARDLRERGFAGPERARGALHRGSHRGLA